MKKSGYQYYIFTVVFMVALFAFAILSWKCSLSTLVSEIEESDITGIDEVDDLVSSLETDIQENIFARYNAIEAYGSLTKALGKNEVNGFEYVRDKDGFLYSGNFWSDVYQRDEEALALEVEEFKEDLNKNGIDFMFISFPQKYNKTWTNGYSGIPYDDFSYEMERFMIQMRKYGINNVDCTSLLEDSGMSIDEMFFKTDHHWTTEASFYCFSYILDELKDMGYDLDPTGYYTDSDNYTHLYYEDMMLGSCGRSTGINYSGYDDFELMYLDDGSEYEYSIVGSNTYYGTIDEALINFSIVDQINENPESIYELSLYDMYLRGIRNQASIINKSNPDGLKVLMLRDSYADPIATYMAPMCSQIDLLWTKYVSEETIQSYIENNDYDIVILALYPDDMSSEFIDF